MRKAKITVLGAIAVAMLGTVSFAEGVVICDDGCDEPPAFGNPGNGKEVGNSPWDGITGNSGNNGGGPRAAPMDGQRSDTPFAQPGGKGNGPSNANKD